MIILLINALFIWVGCSDSKTKIPVKEVKKISTAISALPESVMDPHDNVNSHEKRELGRLLFFDPILSGNKDVACATCHHPTTGYAEFLDISIGTNAKGLGSKRKFNTPNDIPFVKRNAQQ